MKKKNSSNVNFLKILILLAILLISIISFIGIYTLRLNKISNILPDYNFSSDVKGAREFVLVVDKSEEEQKVYIDENNNIVGQAKQDEEGNIKEVDGYTLKTLNVKANNEEILTTQNYENVKKIINERLNILNIQDYKIRLDNQTGDIKLEMKQDKNTDMNYSLIAAQGKFEVKDYQNGIILMDNSNIKGVSVRQNPTVSGGVQIFLVLEFDEEGAKKLNEYSKKYIETKVNEQSVINYITFELDGSTLYTTYFSEEWTVNEIYIPISEDILDTQIINKTIISAEKIANTINTGKLPIKYTLQSDNFVKSGITDIQIKIFKYSIIGVLVLALIVFSIIYKTKGVEIGFANIGFVAIVSLIIRLLGIILSLSGVVAIIVIIIINLIFSILILRNKEQENFNDVFKKYNFKIFPIIIIAIIYALVSNINISSIGMVLFWGIVVFEIYNLLVTKNLIRK